MDQQDFVIRPVTLNDLDWFLEIADLTGPGFTSITKDRKYLEHRLAIVDQSFKEKVNPNRRIFLFVRENLPSKERVGICGIQVNVGYKESFYNYQISTIVQACKSLKIFAEHHIINLVTNFQNASELISFWIHPKHRGQGIAKSLSLCRFLFMAQFPKLFEPEIIAEMRGVCDEQGISPFWEAVGRKFFKMDFATADHHTMSSGKQFIADLVSSEPIYLDLISEEARAVIGVEHPSATAARRLLESVGLRYNNHIDIFDAGPLLNAHCADVSAISNSTLTTVAKVVKNISVQNSAILYNTNINALFTTANIEIDPNGNLNISENTAKILQLTSGSAVRYLIFKEQT